MKGIFSRHGINVTLFLAVATTAFGAEQDTRRMDPGHVYQRQADWRHTMRACRERLLGLDLPDNDKDKLAAQVFLLVMRDYPVQADWMLQDYRREERPSNDYGGRGYLWLLDQDHRQQQIRMIENVLEELGQRGHSLRVTLSHLKTSGVSGNDACWLELYEKACELRRAQRLRSLVAKQQKIVFTKHYNMGGSHYAYTEVL